MCCHTIDVELEKVTGNFFSILSDVGHRDGGAGGSGRVGLQQVRGCAGVP